MELDPRLEADSSFITDLTLCQVRLHHNAAFPWVLLIPKHPGVSEIIDLDRAQQLFLMHEIVEASHVMQHLFQPKKLNVANLGNVVSQLHVHIIARYENDAAWPGPVWNGGVSKDYTPHSKRAAIAALQGAFASAHQI